MYYQIALLGRRDIGLAPDEYAGFTMTLLRMLAFTPNSNSSFTPNDKRSITPNSKVAVTPTENLNEKEILPATALKPFVSSTMPAKKTLSSGNAPMQSNPTIAEKTASHYITATNSIPNEPQFNGDWRSFVDTHLQKLGLGRALAQNCEMIAFDENSISLRVDEANKHLISATYQDKLSAAINAQLGKKIKLIFEIANNEAAIINTPAKQIAVEKATIQSSAEDAILADPFVQDLMQQFGATIIPNTTKPLN